MNLWKPYRSEKAKGYFVVKERKENGEPVKRFGKVFFARLEDAQKHCNMLNDLIRERHNEHHYEKEKRNGKVRNA